MRELREDAGIRQLDMGVMLGFRSRNSLSHVEIGYSQPSDRVARLFASLVGCQLSDFCRPKRAGDQTELSGGPTELSDAA